MNGFFFEIQFEIHFANVKNLDSYTSDLKMSSYIKTHLWFGKITFIFFNIQFSATHPRRLWTR